MLTSLRALVPGLALALAAAACAESDINDSLVDDVDGKLDADSAALIGSWNEIEISTEPNPDKWLVLVLKRDKRFYLWPETGDGIEGSYKLRRTTDDPPDRFIALTPDDGDAITREYRLDDDGQLEVRKGTGSWHAMERSEQAVCVVAEDCGLQNLKHPTCLGDWACGDEGTCSYQCR